VITRDASLIYLAAFLRSSAVGLVGVILAIALTEAGVSVAGTGLVIGAGLAGIAVMTAVVTFAADGLGRRRTLIALGALTMCGYIAAAAVTRIVWLLPAAFAGMLNGMGRDRGPAGTLEQAILPETTDAAHRTWVLAWYNLVLDAGHALGGLAGIVPTLLAAHAGLSLAEAHRWTFYLCAGAAAASVVPYALLSHRVEVGTMPGESLQPPDEDRKSRRAITRLALLFGIDSLGGGFLSSALIAYWFFQRYGLSEQQLAVLFFAARALNAASHVAAAWMARRFGLLNTMVLTHLPSSLLLMAAPAAPSGALAAALFLGRESLVEMDVPTRQSYVMAIVPPSRRTYASGVTNLTRTIGWAVGPPIAGAVMQSVSLAAPLFVGGGLKIAYDVILYRAFRHLRPPEEAAIPAAQEPG
jgi:MFS family permease